MSKPTGQLAEVDNLRGASWMFAASVCFALTGILMKKLTETVPPMEIAFVRSLMGLVVLAPLIMRHGWGIYRTPSTKNHLIRIAFSTGSISAGTYAVAHIPLVMAVSLSFTRPLFMILIAMLFLGEIVGWRRGLATIIGFLGVLVMLGPSEFSLSPGAFAALAAAACLAGTMAMVRRQSATDSAATMMCWATTGVCFTTAIPALLVWQTPSAVELAFLAAMGINSSIGQYMMIKAFTYGEATVVNPIDYAQIIFTSLAGYFLFGEFPTVWTLSGAAIIMAATLYIIFRDAKLRKKVATTPSPNPPPDP